MQRLGSSGAFLRLLGYLTIDLESAVIVRRVGDTQIYTKISGRSGK